jgi:hypothetical protein
VHAGYAPSFEKVTPFSGRVAKAARWPDLRAQSRRGKYEKTLVAPGKLEQIIERLKKRLNPAKPSKLGDLEKRVAQAEGRVRNATDALVKMGYSAAMAEAVKREETKLTELQGELAAVQRDAKPRVIPHPTLVRKVLEQLFEMANRNQDSGRALLRRFMPPSILTPQKDGKWKMTGGFDIEAVFEVCDTNSRRDRD